MGEGEGRKEREGVGYRKGRAKGYGTDERLVTTSGAKLRLCSDDLLLITGSQGVLTVPLVLHRDTLDWPFTLRCVGYDQLPSPFHNTSDARSILLVAATLGRLEGLGHGPELVPLGSPSAPVDPRSEEGAAAEGTGRDEDESENGDHDDYDDVERFR